MVQFNRNNKNKVYYQNENSSAHLLPNALLKPWELTIQDGEIHKNEELHPFLKTVMLERRAVLVKRLRFSK